MVNLKLKYIIKRLIDLILGIGLSVIFMPLIVLVAISIKLTSPGVIIFKQERVGLYEQRFMCYKFRSMIESEQNKADHQNYINILMQGNSNEDLKHDGRYKLNNKNQITKIGRFIRKFSIDELPQLWNVIKGEMSIVGPRPSIPYELENYNNHMLKRFQVKPGLTGLWQISGRAGIGYKEMLEMDINYVEKWTLILDLIIILKTPQAVFKVNSTS